MSSLLPVVCALIGLAVAPLVNLLIDRVPAREPLLPLGARCPAAPDQPHVAPGLAAGWWALLRGACPACGRGLGARYLLVDALTAGLFAAAAVRFGADWVLPAYLVLFASLVAISLIDLEHFIIPNRIVYPTLALALPLLVLAAAAEHRWSSLRHALLGGALAWGGLLVVHLISPRGMGFGDVRLAFVLGLFLGWLSLGHVLAGLFLGFLLGAATGVALIAFTRRGRKDHIPFGPFLAAGAVLAVFAGSPLLDLYLQR